MYIIIVVAIVTVDVISPLSWGWPATHFSFVFEKGPFTMKLWLA